MKIYQLLIIQLVVFLFIGCGGGATTNPTAPTSAASPTDVLKHLRRSLRPQRPGSGQSDFFKRHDENV